MSKSAPRQLETDIVNLIRETGPKFVPEIARALNVPQSAFANLTSQLVWDKVLKVRKLRFAGADSSKRMNCYSIADGDDIPDGQVVIRTEARTGDAPQIQEGFNPADPFRIARKANGRPD